MLPYRIAEPPPTAAVRALSLEDAYMVALGIHRTHPCASNAAYRLYCIDASGVRFLDVLAEPSSRLVIGRHTRCDGVLEADETVALRHLLVRCARLDDGCARLSVIDLRTHQGFDLSDGTTQRSIWATGPLALRLSTYALIALPTGCTLPDALPRPLCQRLGAPPPWGRWRRAPAPSPAPGSNPAMRGPASRVLVLPETIMLSERVWAPAGQQAHGDARGAPRYEVSLRVGNRGASVWLSEGELESGVLVGRAPRCLDERFREMLTLGVSRTHLLLLREGGRSLAYDVASSQGTFERGLRVGFAVLADEGTSLALGTSTGAWMFWRRA